jgi:predicted GNAT family acetyltransferase
MQVRRIEDPVEFSRLLEPLAGPTPGRHNLILGLARVLVDRPDIYPEFNLWVVEDGGRVVAAALRTLPYRVVLSDTDEPDAVRALVAELDEDTPGVTANRPTVDWAVEAWRRRGGEASLSMAQGVFEATAAEAVPVPDGGPRPARPADRDLLVEWVTEFSTEAIPDPNDLDRIAAAVERTLARPADEAGYWLWEADGEPRALAAHGGRTGHGIRIGPVYTPPQWRRRGYATALVAAQTAWLLESGNSACFLYTDLSNPTSNAIYQRIGYRQVGESAEYRFGNMG